MLDAQRIEGTKSVLERMVFFGFAHALLVCLQLAYGTQPLRRTDESSFVLDSAIELQLCQTPCRQNQMLYM